MGVQKPKVLLGLEPRLWDRLQPSESHVLTNYTIRPLYRSLFVFSKLAVSHQHTILSIVLRGFAIAMLTNEILIPKHTPKGLSLLQRRSDQRRNRIFTSSFNLVVMEEPTTSTASNSADQMPSPAVPDRPGLMGSPLHSLNLFIT